MDKILENHLDLKEIIFLSTKLIALYVVWKRIFLFQPTYGYLRPIITVCIVRSLKENFPLSNNVLHVRMQTWSYTAYYRPVGRASQRRRSPWPKPGFKTLLWTRLQRVKMKMNVLLPRMNESVWSALYWDKRYIRSDALPLMSSLIWPLGMYPDEQQNGVRGWSRAARAAAGAGTTSHSVFLFNRVSWRGIYTASTLSWHFVEYNWHVPPTTGLILQLLCSPIGNWNFQKDNKYKHRDWVDAPQCIQTNSWAANTRAKFANAQGYLIQTHFQDLPDDTSIRPPLNATPSEQHSLAAAAIT